MSCVEWIVCERTSRWAAALRLELSHRNVRFRIRETRCLTELDSELAVRPNSLAAVEVHRGNLADALTWLSSVRARHCGTRCASLVDRSLAVDLVEVCDVLAEAGVQAIATSPRRLDEVVALGQRHALKIAEIDNYLPLAAQAWASLPWQER
jgi:hypothetical protein